MLNNQSRRDFLQKLSGGLGVTIASLTVADAIAMPAPAVPKDTKKLGVALVGLGSYAKNQLAVALEKTANCSLVGIVTGTPAKADEWQKKCNLIKRIFTITRILMR